MNCTALHRTARILMVFSDQIVLPATACMRLLHCMLRQCAHTRMLNSLSGSGGLLALAIAASVWSVVVHNERYFCFVLPLLPAG